MMDVEQLQGAELGGFRLTRLLGCSAMAAVYRGENVLDPSIVRAIKVLRPELTRHPDFVQRLAQEARFLENLQHPSIVRFHGVRRDQGLVLMELELLLGVPLSQRIRASANDGLPLRLVLTWLWQACDGIGVAHALGIVHRDLNPEQLFITNAGEVKVLNFGMARALGGDPSRPVPFHTPRKGALPYQAPELFHGASPTVSSDVYALGVTLCQALVGYYPRLPEGKTLPDPLAPLAQPLPKLLPALRTLRSEVPDEVQRIFETAVSVEPSARYANAREFAAALASALKTMPGAAVSPLPPNELLQTPPTGLEPSAPVEVRSSPDSLDRDEPLSFKAPQGSMPSLQEPPSKARTLGGSVHSTKPSTRAAPKRTRPRSWTVAAAAALIFALTVSGFYALNASRRNRLHAECEAGSVSACTAACVLGFRPLPQDCTAAGQLQERSASIEDRFKATQSYELGCQHGAASSCVQLGRIYEQGVFPDAGEPSIKKDEPRAAELYRKACESADLAGCGEHGRVLSRGIGVSKNVLAGAELLMRACTGAYLASCSELAGLHIHGKGVARDLSAAIAMYQRACDGDYAEACFELGLRTRDGRGVPRDPQRASMLLEKAQSLVAQGCGQGDVKACVLAGHALEHGWSNEPASTKALSLYQKACSLGFTPGCESLGEQLMHGADGVDKDESQARQFLDRACKQGSGSGCKKLGDLIAERAQLDAVQAYQRAVELSLEPCRRGQSSACEILASVYANESFGYLDPSQALTLYQSACDDGSFSACVALGDMYRLGRKGLEPNATKALNVYQQSCDMGSGHACTLAGLLYREGGAITQDPTRAANLFRRACALNDALGCAMPAIYDPSQDPPSGASGDARRYDLACHELGSTMACVRLGGLYLLGEGVPKDLGQANRLFELACNRNGAEACSALADSYLHARGFARSIRKARGLYQKACEIGYKNACTSLRQLEHSASVGDIMWHR